MDVYLQALNSLLDESDDAQASIAVTLHLGGGVLHGHMISHRAWREAWLDQIHESDPAVAAFLNTALAAVLTDPDDPDPSPEPHLHLRDVTYHHGPESAETSLWRGPMSAVSGWSLTQPRL
ncbi:hypothetical protein GCM10010400_03210 [Streptomyces aculeolatus]|uniref:hypothetical protein n=1 Tax=Streptomyces aculeolatus TaxID=270689 RepID=UPI001CEC879C|nr:hypothetical protein [Streptomyces aculeolatus]